MAVEGEDDAMLVAYLAGELDEAERLRLEQRLAAEPALAEQLLALEAVDLVAASLRERAAPVAGIDRAARRRLQLGVWSVAAAAAVIAFVLFGRGAGEAAMPCRVRAVASFATAGFDDYAERLGLPPDVRYAGNQRGPDRAPGVPADRFLAVVADREAMRSREALAAPQAPLGEGAFTLRVDVERQCHVLVLQLDVGGRWSRRFPARADAVVFGEATNPLSPGIHTLPRPVVLANAVGTLSLHPGFDVPSDQALPQTWLLLAALDRPIEPALIDQLDAAAAADPESIPAAATSAADIAAWVERRSLRIGEWLAARGFATCPLEVAHR